MRPQSGHIHFAALLQGPRRKLSNAAFGLPGNNRKRASINECDREAGIFILRRFSRDRGESFQTQHLVCRR
ncbi:hypothetical protein C3V36_14365 [Lachnospiraceae bacterium oral taxon 500]|nr:hypothetical protein C3V36_14365 [Lachnospiraceae bacterium oral taxon 500]